MMNRQHAKSSTSEIVDMQVVMYIIYIYIYIYIYTSLCVNELTFLQFSVKCGPIIQVQLIELLFIIYHKYYLLCATIVTNVSYQLNLLKLA